MTKSKIKLNKKYKRLFTSNSRFYLCTGGRGSSKSYSISTYVALLLLFEAGHTILYTRYTLTSAHISIIPEFIEKIETLGQLDKFEITKDSIICKTTGSKIIFRGLKSSSGKLTANLKSLAGVTTWILDEAEELIDEDIFDKINLSIRQKGIQNRIIMILNPATKEHWIYTKFFQERGVAEGSNTIINDTTYIHTTYLDNIKHLDESFIKEIEAIKLKNPKKYEHVIMGGWLDKAEGVIYSNWKIGEFNDNLNHNYGADWGYSSDPSTLIKVAIDKKNKKIYLDEKLYKPHLVTSDLIQIFEKECGNQLIVADNSEGRLIEEFSRAGFNIKKCNKGAGSIVEGITLIQDYELIVTSTSTNLMKELNNYVWSDKRSGTPRDLYNHLMDAMRYIITDQLKYESTPMLYF